MVEMEVRVEAMGEAGPDLFVMEMRTCHVGGEECEAEPVRVFSILGTIISRKSMSISSACQVSQSGEPNRF